MSSSLCFLCHNFITSYMSEDIREKYEEIVGIYLAPDTQLCHLCSHELNKFWQFRTLCVKRSLQFPVLYGEKGLINLQRTRVQVNVLCPESQCNIDSIDFSDHHYDTNDITDNVNEICDKIKDEDVKFDKEDDAFANEINSPKLEHNEIDDNHDFDEANSDELNGEEYAFDGNNLPTKAEIENNVINEDKIQKEKVKKKKNKKKFKKVVLTVDEQKTQLESKRKEKKYMESEFKCYNCAIGFLFKDTYQAHMMRHEESNGEFVCSICTLRFASSSVLRAHKATHSNRYTCTVCKAPVRGKARKTHADRCHRGVTVSANCHLCGRVFKDANGLQQHLRRYHGRGAAGGAAGGAGGARRRLACVVCAQQCNTHAALRTHIIKHIKRSFPCDSCASTFSSPYTLTQHKKTKHSTNTDDIQLFYCEMCKVSFSNKKGLMAHKRNTVKHQQTYVECEICYRVLTTRRALLRHVQSVHCLNKPARNKNAQSPVVCHVCGHSFKGKSKLSRHLKKVCEKDKFEEPPLPAQPPYQEEYPFYYENTDMMHYVHQ